MQFRTKHRVAAAAASCLLSFASFQASPEDIDIFAVDESNLVARPNVLFVLDNSANWSRASQQWPENEQQGQSEASAIKQVINELDAGVNIGLMEFATEGSAGNQDSAYIRYHIRPMTAANKTTLSYHLDTIYNNINAPVEKRPQSNPFGNLFWDVYNYLASEAQSQAGAGTPASRADGSAYQSLYEKFQSPLTSADSCTRTVVIFIGNNVSNGPTPDSTDNVRALYDLAGGGASGDAAIAQIPFADYAVTTSVATATLDYTAACYSSATACTTAQNTTACTDQGFTSCFCDTTDKLACPSTHWTVTGTNKKTVTKTISGPTTTVTSKASTGDIVQTCKTSGQMGSLTSSASCPASSDITLTNTPQTGQKTRTQTSWADCRYYDIGTTGCSGAGKANYEKKGTKTEIVTVTEDVVETTVTDLGDTSACYNDTTTCKTTDFSACSNGTFSEGCQCSAASNTTGCPPGTTYRHRVKGNYNVTQATQTGTFHTAPTGPFMMDEWARFLRQTGVLVPDGGGIRSQVTTYTVDVFNAQQHPDFSALLFNAARVGGGKYFQAKDKNTLVAALRQILTEVQAVNSAFSSASLPVNATNRAQNENQVFIGVFKPDRQKRPDWFGNLKRYQLISSGATIDLGDANGVRAINTQTGFITDCAVSFWTEDSGDYWLTPNTTDPVPISACTTNSTSDYSDSPDGPFVEKGAVAEVVRRGNDPTATPDADGNFELNRKVYTRTSTTVANSVPPDFNDTTTGLDPTLVDFIRGADVNDEDVDSPADLALKEPRSSIHGDVVHSRPQPLNFGGSTGVVVFYGANDGHYRAVKASTGQELWSFVAPEHWDQLSRLYKNTPNVRFYGDSNLLSEPKDYFFDGSTGVYQTFNADGTSNTAYIYPSMRRGGRKLYAFNVSDPANPRYMWDKGCDSNDDTTCDSGFTAMGETWPLPNVALIKGYCGSGGCSTTSPPQPVVVMGGGYDPCDDQNTATPCAASRGRGVYVLDATNGTLLKHFDFSGISGARGVAADVALIDVDADKMVDYGYAVDTAGNIYRMDFIDGPSTKVALDKSSWRSSRVAYTNASSGNDPRKFLFPPALVQATSSVIYLAIGTGDREHPLKSNYPYGTEGDPASAILNRFYVFKDLLSDVDSSTATNLDDTGTMADYTDSNSCSNASILPSSSQKGWFIDLDAYGQGEQTVTSAVIAAGFVFFSTNRPTAASTTACTTSLGEARGYFLNLLNGSGAIGVAGACGGSRSSTFVGGGLPPSPVLATVPIDGQLRTVVIGAVQKTGEPSSPIEAQRVRPPIASDRKPIYWYKSTGDK